MLGRGLRGIGQVTAWWVHPVDDGACCVSRVGPSRMICRVFVNVFDALVHVSECRRKSASTAVGERMTETTGISLWEKVVMRLRRFAFPCVSVFWQVMLSPEPTLGCGRVDRRGSVAIL